MRSTTHTLVCGAAAVALALGLAGHGQAAEKVALDLKLPRPLFVGTPKNIKLPNLEKPLKDGSMRPDFMIPAGTVNLAENKEITSSDDYPIIGDLEMITDGDKEGTDGSYVELGPGVQWVQVDLETPGTIYAVVLWHYHAQPRAYLDVVVQASNDPDFIEGVTTLYNNDHDNSAGFGVGKHNAYIEGYEGRIIDAKGTTARYLRCYSKGNTSNEMNHYIELEAHGHPAK